MNIGPVEDRLEIRELMETFAVGFMRLDLEIWMTVWAEEGSWKLPSMQAPAKGHAELRAAFTEKTAYLKYITLLMFPTDLVIEGDKAYGRGHGQEVVLPKIGGMKFIVGYFDDEYVKRGGRWYFLSRNYTPIGIENFFETSAAA